MSIIRQKLFTVQNQLYILVGYAIAFTNPLPELSLILGGGTNLILRDGKGPPTRCPHQPHRNVL
jgi:hypothetical protein